ncbi:helix-turn-helix transcriptional regulator [Tsuneonella sp. HG249]
MAALKFREVAATDFNPCFEQMLGVIDARPRVVVDRERRVLWESPDAARLLQSPSPLHISGGVLGTDHASSTSTLAEFLEDASTACDSLLIRSRTQRHWAMILAWTPKGLSNTVCVLANLSIPYKSVKESGLARALQLTAAEARVLDEFSLMRCPREIADNLNISLSTVRTHLKQIHSKSGVASAVQLTQLVRGYCAC